MRQATLRILDVNLNRAAEGLRTLEDIARVIYEDATSSSTLKALRHSLGEFAAKLPRLERLESRAAHSDAGTNLTTKSESSRANWNEVVTAACERVTQSLRVIEEASKIDFSSLAGEIKQLRYRAYDDLALVENRLTIATSPGLTSFSGSPLYLLVGCEQPIEDFVATLRELQQAGVGLFQIRDKRADGAQLLQYARAAVASVGADCVVVNDRVDVALASGAGTVHVGQEDLPIAEVRRLSRRKLWIGVSTHDIAQARAAQQAGADYIGCGPTFPSTTKQFEQFAGIDFLKQVAAEISIPAYAIGGISIDNIDQVRQTGLSRVALSGAILSAKNPSDAAKALDQKLQQNNNP